MWSLLQPSAVGTPFADGLTEAQQHLCLGLHLSGSVACVNASVTVILEHVPCTEPWLSLFHQELVLALAFITNRSYEC